MADFENQPPRGGGPLRRLIGMSFRLGIPWQVALQQNRPPLSQPESLCNDKASSVEQFSANGVCLTNSVSQKSPQSTLNLSHLLAVAAPSSSRVECDKPILNLSRVPGQRLKGDHIPTNTPRWYFNKIATMIAAVSGVPMLFAQRPATGTSRRSNHIHDGIYYFPGIGSNSGYPREDRILVTDPFEKHVTRTMDALKRSLERVGGTMDSILHLEVYICLPHSDSIPIPAGKARFDAHTAQYRALNKIYGTYFGPGKAPARACMAVEWIPGDSLIEVVGSALVVNPPSSGA